jgi:Tol biopolymer transport system component
MSLAPGDRIGSCEVTALIGAGGMGEVYRGRDTRLGRDVAIKALPDGFAQDAERLARFEREAHVLASLNHPNIAIIHELKEVDGATYLVLELVDGDTLEDRIARGPLSIDEALGLAQQMAEALEATHEKGIVHRDLKPANVKVTLEGRVKVLDFGLAKVTDRPNVPSDLSHSPTLTAAHTGSGVILGTAAYMSPEQARGRTVDRRADIWAFGCVLYELLTGRRAFPVEDTVSDTVAGILKGEPDWRALPAGTPQKIRALLERCLRKDVRRRLPHIGEARIEIEEVCSEPAGTRATAEAVRNRPAYLWPALTALMLLAVAALAIWIAVAPAPEPAVVQFDIVGPQGETVDVGQPLSPDGRYIAFIAPSAGRPLLWIRSLDSRTPRPLAGTEGATRPAWSPDSRHLAFFAGGQLKRVALAGGPPAVICNEPGRDVAWGAGDVILIGGQDKGLLRVPASGGEPVPATELDPNELTHDYPDFLPDGRHFLYMARRGAAVDDWDVYVGSLDSQERRRLSGVRTGARYSPSGHVLFNRGRTLMAQPFDLARLELAGDAFPVSEGNVDGPRAPFSASTGGSLAYLAQQPDLNVQLTWFDRAGRQLALVGPPGEYERASLSRGDRTVAFDRVAGGSRDIFLLDVERNLVSRFVSAAGADFAPTWSADSRTIAFASSRDPAGNAGQGNVAAGNLYERAVGVVGDDKVLLKSEGGKTPTDWSRDGRYLAYTSGGDIWALPWPLSGDAKPLRVTDTAFAEGGAKFSPDGRWIAYQSSESAVEQDVYIQSFPDRRVRKQVSVNGGFVPRWRPDGGELFYIAPDFTLMAVSITVMGSELEVGTAVPLFHLRGQQHRDYDVSRDGRFLVGVPVGDRTVAPVTVIVNWAAGLEN